MDPLTHTLVGASLAATPLGAKTRRATAALVIGANLPDLDALTYFVSGDAALGFRRGWTHGVPALLVLPALLTLLLWLWPSWRRKAVSTRPISRPWLLGLSYLAVATHPCLDWLNTYGMRWWMPFNETWYYGDAVFIVDPWLWLVLGTGWVLGRRRGAGRLAGAGLLVAVLYVATMLSLHSATEQRVELELARVGIRPIDQLMVGPIPARPLSWELVVRSGDRIRSGRYSWLREEPLVMTDGSFRAAESFEVWDEVLASGQVTGLLRWARFPWLELEETGNGRLVHLMDARYARRRTDGFGGAVVSLPDDR